MDILNNVLNCIGIIIMAIGIICIYDARKLTKKFFSSKDTNNTTKVFKIVGFTICIIGSAIVLINV